MKHKISILFLFFGCFSWNSIAQFTVLKNNYSNQLTDNSTKEDFIDNSLWWHVDLSSGIATPVEGFDTAFNGEYIGNSTAFVINSQSGLQLTTDSKFGVDGVYALNMLLPSQKSFTATIKAKLSNSIDTTTINPLYTAGFGILKINTSDLKSSSEQRVIINLEKHKDINKNFYNEIGSSRYNGDDTTAFGTKDNDFPYKLDEVYLKVDYNSVSKEAITYYSEDGVVFNPVRTFDLNIWSITNSDQLGIILYAGSLPFQDVNEYLPNSSYNTTIELNEILLKDFNITYISSASSSEQITDVYSQESQESKAKKSNTKKKSKAKGSSKKKSKANKSNTKKKSKAKSSSKKKSKAKKSNTKKKSKLKT